jgi:hypothetical protein
MSRTSILGIVSATLMAIGTAYWLSAGEPKRPWPKPTPPPEASPVYHDVDEPIPTVEEVDRAIATHNERAEAEILAALAQGDVARREAAVVFLLPELVQVEPGRVVAMVARQEPGPMRERLRDEVALIWASQDLPAATRWLLTLDEAERKKSARAAVEMLMPVEPLQAAALARELGLDPKAHARERLSAR